MTMPFSPSLAPALVPALCPVCHHTHAAPFFDGGEQPLATIAWPETAEAARAMPRHPLDFVQCPACSHVWNRRFSYAAIPYGDKPNRMFNTGGIWRGHLAATRDALLARLPARPTVVEIGCGEGHFLRGLAEAGGGGRYAGFDPSATPENGRGIEFHARLFEPLADMAAFAPDAVIIRHVLEHLTGPAELIEGLAWGAAALGKPCLLFAEVPCIDRVFATGRLADFYFEHASHFTRESFRTLLRRGGRVAALEHGYDGEVLHALVELGMPAARRRRAARANAFAAAAAQAQRGIAAQLDALAASGKSVAIWGGTGKGAAFIHHFGADARRFPLVVDSDPSKAGTCVPGSGQTIRFRDALKAAPVDVLIIPTQWRAADILAEMAREGIRAGQVLIEHDGRLVDFGQAAHPYARPGGPE